MVCYGFSSFFFTFENVVSFFESKFFFVFYKLVKGEFGIGKEWFRKGIFLYSENSVFESWNVY